MRLKSLAVVCSLVFMKQVLATPTIPENISNEIYDVEINHNWDFTAPISSDKENIYIPLKYLPSDMLGTLVPSVLKSGENLEVPKKLIDNIDTDSLKLSIALSEIFFKTQDISSITKKVLTSTPINALIFNYDVNLPFQNPSQTKSTFNLNWDSKNDWIMYNDFLWNSKKPIRLDDTWEKQYSDNHLLVLGDTSNTALSGFNSIKLLGFRYASSYYNSPNYMKDSLPAISLNGFAVNPTKLDLYLNNQLIQSSEIGSGKYNLDYTLQTQGFGVVDTYVYDLTGKPTVVSVPFYANNEVIKQGDSAYDISGGLIRKNYGTDSFDYHDFIVNALYKKGITKGYTQDFFIQSSSQYSVIASRADWIPSPYIGLFQAGIAYNTYHQSLWSLGLQHATNQWSLGATLDKSSDFCYGFDQPCVKKQIQFYGGIPIGKDFGSLTANYAQRQLETGKSSIFNIQWNKEFFGNISLFANISKTKNTDTENNQDFSNKATAYYLGVSINLGKNIYSNSSMSKSKGSGTSLDQSINISQNNEHPERGFGTLTYSKNTQNDAQNVNLYYGADLKNFSYQINAYKDSKSSVTANGIFTGSIAYIPQDNYISFNRISQSGLAYVKINDLTTPVPILHENKFSGYTDSLGRLLVPDSTALNTETISIDINKLPKDINIEEYKKQYYIPFSGAVEVNFKAKNPPYVATIKGVNAGAIFNIGENYYVVGKEGKTALDNNGTATIPLENGKTCTLNFINTKKEYDCSEGENK